MTTVSPAETLRRQASMTTHKLRSLPILVLMAHSRCNCRCVMCDIWKANAMKRELTHENLMPHIEPMRRMHVQRVVLSGGEALMHSNLWKLCELLKDELDVRITLLSTGLLLKTFAEQIVKWCDEVIVSLDGSREVHDSIRRIPRAFDRLAEGIAALRSVAPGYPVSGRSVLHRTNFRDFPNMIDAAHAIGLDRISFMAADVSSTAFNRPTPWDEPRVDEVALTAEEAAEFTTIIEAAISDRPQDFSSGFIAESPDKLRRLPQYYAGLNGLGELPVNSCNAPWISSVIETDGDVKPCFFHNAIGNIYQQPLDTILNSPKAVEFRRNLDVRSDPTCRACVCTLHLGRRAPA